MKTFAGETCAHYRTQAPRPEAQTTAQLTDAPPFPRSKGAIRAPSEQRTDQSVQDLVTRLDSVPQVIFHCTLSQVRGPKAARIYAEARREKEKQQGVQQRDASATPATGSHEQEEDLESAKEKARTFAPDPYAAAKATVADRAQTRQEVFVLRDGFQNWQGLYRVSRRALVGPLVPKRSCES